MSFNESKFEIIRYDRNDTLKDNTCYHSFPGSITVMKNSVNDLGVHMSCDGSFKFHIDQIIETSKKIFSCIQRVFHSRSQSLMITLRKSLVIPRLEYCSQLWCPQKVGIIPSLEALQWNYIRKIDGSKYFDYWQNLKRLGLFFLQRRRKRYQIITYGNILKGWDQIYI